MGHERWLVGTDVDRASTGSTSCGVIRVKHLGFLCFPWPLFSCKATWSTLLSQGPMSISDVLTNNLLLLSVAAACGTLQVLFCSSNQKASAQSLALWLLRMRSLPEAPYTPMTGLPTPSALVRHLSGLSACLQHTSLSTPFKCRVDSTAFLCKWPAKL